MPVLKRSSTYKAKGIVLSRRELGDTDRIVTLYTREFGLRRLVARGSRKPSSPLAPHIELFNHVRVFAAVGTNLDILSQVEALETYPRLRSDLGAFAAAGWAIELLDGLSEQGERVPQAYEALLTFLRGLDLSEQPPEFWLGAVALTLLDIHGYRPELEVCADCGREIEAGHHAFAAAVGGLLCDSCAPRHDAQPLSIEVLKTLRYLLAEGFHGAVRMTANPTVRAEVRQILRGYATATVEREIKSARMLEDADAGPRPRR